MGRKIGHCLLEKLVGVLLILVANSANVKQAQAQGPQIPALFAFGDSILDTGNNNNLHTFTKCNFPPYGRDFLGGLASGRFNDGKVPSDLIGHKGAAALRIKDTLPAYQDPNLRSEDLPTGVSFASGGSGNDNLTASIQGVLSLATQLQMFKEYIGRLKGIVGEEKANSIIPNSLYLLSAGNNDIAITYSGTIRRGLPFPSYANLLVSWASDFLKDLYEVGARRVWVLSTLPLGCLPGARATCGGFCIDIKNKEAEFFNTMLSSGLDSLKRSLTDYALTFVDVYTPLLGIINNPQSSGFNNVANGCCGTGTIEIGVSCNVFNPLICPNPSTHVFWDAGHPTQRAYEIVVSDIIRKIPTSN